MRRKPIKIGWEATPELAKSLWDLIEDYAEHGNEAQQHVYHSFYVSGFLEGALTILMASNKDITTYFVQNYGERYNKLQEKLFEKETSESS